MGTTHRIALALVLFSATAFGTVAQASKVDEMAEVAAMHAVDQAWLKAYNAGDADALANLYMEDAMFMPPGAAAISGRAAIKAYFVNDVAATAKAGLSFSLGAQSDGGAHGNLGWVSGTYTVKDKAGHVVDTGKYLSVSKKKNGKWMYLRDTYNSDAPPPSSAPAPAQKP